MGSPMCDKGHYHIYCRPNCRRAWYCSLAVAGPRARQVALGLNDAGKIVEARRRIGMFPAERLLADRQRALIERPAPSQGRSGPEADPQDY